jgi:hypothetical protein
MKITKFTEKSFNFQFSTNSNTAIPSKEREKKSKSKVTYSTNISDLKCLRILMS